MKYGAGEFREVIDIISKVKTPDGMGGYIVTDNTKLHCMAIVRGKRSKDGVVSGRDLEIRTHEVIIRLSSVEPQKNDKILWRGKTLAVKTVLPDYSDMFCVMECVNEV